MRKYNIIIVFTLVFAFCTVSAQNLQPYILGAESTEGLNETITSLKSNLENNSFRIIGEYTPANDKNRRVIVVTSNDILSSVKKFGGLRGFAASLRIGITSENSKAIVSYINPIYWGHAYFQSDFARVSGTYNKIYSRLKSSMKGLGSVKNKPFGSEDGIEPEDLEDYHYMMTMPYFEDVVEIKTFKSYEDAVKTIDRNLKSSKNAEKVYKIEVPGHKLTLYGIGLSGEDGESHFLPKIDIANPKHTAFLPYELLVMDKEVVMLHGRYRIAISFPDLTMGTFVGIMSTPGDIEDMMEALTK